MWVPGQGSELLLVSDTFVKLYDTKVDIVSPSFYFELPMGKIRDATIAITDQVGEALCWISSFTTSLPTQHSVVTSICNDHYQVIVLPAVQLAQVSLVIITRLFPDMCFVSQDKFVVIITSQGKIYYQPIIYDLSVQEGPIYFTMDLAISDPNVVVSGMSACVCVRGYPVMIQMPPQSEHGDWLATDLRVIRSFFTHYISNINILL